MQAWPFKADEQYIPNMYKKFIFAVFILKYVRSDMEGNIMEGNIMEGNMMEKYLMERYLMELYITQGHYTYIKHYPHQVFLEINGRKPSVCGGSILNQIFILTAAHCLSDLDNSHSRVIVLYGSENIKRMTAKAVQSYLIHPDFSQRSMKADIALVRCVMPLKFGKLTKKVAIMKNIPQWKNGFVSGWGTMNEFMDSPDAYQILKHTVQEVQTRDVCKLIGVPGGSFCAGPIREPGHPTIGDSGGALVINEYIQIGIVSYKVTDYTLVSYTNVSYYYTWIHQSVQAMYCEKG